MSMSQAGIMENCSNQCDFCLLKEKKILSIDEIIYRLDFLMKNMDYIDWQDKFKHGISILGGELFFIDDPRYIEKFMEFIDCIIEKIIKPSTYKFVRCSTVSNGIYDPNILLFKVMDRFKETVGLDRFDINFSYDLKYRFKTEESRLRCLETIKAVNDRYNKPVNVQMILTQHVINLYNEGKFDYDDIVKNHLNGNHLYFLYPHKSEKACQLDEFFFNRPDFINFIAEYKSEYPYVCECFIQSVINSSKFKHSMWNDRESDDVTQQPVLEDDKSVFNEKCGHSVLYQCYSDTDRCMLCDLELLD